MTDKLTIAAYKTNASGGTQITIEQTNEDGRGWGRRLAGPKHYNLGTQTLVKAELDADDAREIRRMLDEVFPQDSAESVSVARLRKVVEAVADRLVCDTATTWAADELHAALLWTSDDALADEG